MSSMQKFKILDIQNPMDRSIIIGIGLLVVWLIALMTFMENGQSHALNLFLIGVLIVLLLLFSRVLQKSRYQGYLLAVGATMIAVASYLRLGSFFIHNEIVFTLAVISVTARWGIKHGIFTALLSLISLGLIELFLGHNGMPYEIMAMAGYFFVSVLIVGTLTTQRESALKARSQMSEELNQTYSETLQALVTALDMRDSETGGHSDRVTRIALNIANQLRLDEKTIQEIRWGSILHDVGKIGIPDNILRKPGKLTDEEWSIMRNHPQLGFDMLQDIPFLKHSLDIVRHHHERYDGSGYPDGLKGDEIPLQARIFSIADTYDAMTNDRPYRKALSHEETVKEILRCSTTQFDPKVVEAFSKSLEIPQ